MMKTMLLLRYVEFALHRKRTLFLAFTLALFCYSLSAQNATRYLDGGTISTADNTTICVDGVPDPIDVNLENARGRIMKWIITDDNNTILALPPSPPFDLDGAGPGVCRIWNISYNFLRGLDVGVNLSDLRGFYDLSNYISVIRNQPEGGTLEGGPFEFTSVGDGQPDNIPEGAITLSGNSGGNSQWVVTDSQGVILGLPPSPYVVDFDGAGDGVCLVWHLSFEDGLEGAEPGNNAATDLVGCYSLSNPVEVIRSSAVDGGTLEGGPFEFCVGDEEADNIPEGAITLTGNSGTNSQWVVTDSDGIILGLPPSPYVVDFDGAGDGTCLVWHLSFEDGLQGAEVGNNASTDLVGTYDLSNPISVIRNQPEGGTLEGGPFEFTSVGDGQPDNIPEGAITLSGNSGGNSQWVVTDSQGVILGLPPSPYVVDFDGAGDGVCLVWHLSFEDGLEGAEPGNNAATDLVGCYSLSNPIEVIRNSAVDGGTLEGGPFEFCVGDEEADNIPEGAITLTGNSGTNSQWVVTDSDGVILGLPPSPYVVDFDGAGDGTCLVWHLSFEDGLQGAEVGNNASTDLVGTYDLSNPISVTRNQPEGGTLEGGPFEFTSVGDGQPDNIPEGAITLSGNSGGNSQWVVTDSQGVILGLPPSPYVVDFDGAGDGVCLVWHLSFEDGLEGAEPGNNAATDLVGCYSLSNPVEVIRSSAVDGGTLEGGPFEFCVGDEEADNIPEGAITLTGNSGTNSQWVVTDSDGIILGLPPSPYVVDFDGAGDGTCLVWHLSFEDGLQGAEVGNNASTDLVGTYDLSNPISVIRNQPEGGTLEGGPFEFTSVGDGQPDNIPEGAITLSGNSGGNSQWVVTDSQGVILGLPPSPYVVDFDGAGDGVCLVWHLSFEDGLEGAEPGNNAATDLVGCYSLSNPIEVIRSSDDGECTVDGGHIQPGGLYFFCEGDGEADYATGITLNSNSGSNSQWVVTDIEGNILGLPPSPDVVNFDGAGPGICLIWHLSFDGTLEGAEAGNNAFSDLSGCYDLSNPIPVFRFPSGGVVCELLSYSTQEDSLEISMYPNPARKNVNIDLSKIASENVSVKIYDFYNKEMLNTKIDINNLNRKSMQIDVSSYNSGFYLVSITDENNNIMAVKRLIVN